MKTLPHLLLITAALFLFVGNGHAQGPCINNSSPCILVSDFAEGNIQEWSDDGSTRLSPNLLAADGGGGGEGIACLSGGANVLYTAHDTSAIEIYSMTLSGNPPQLRHLRSFTASGIITGLANNTMVLYAAENPDIGSFTPLPSSPYLTQYNANTMDNSSNNVALGVCPPNVQCGYAGNIFTTSYALDTGVLEFMPNTAGLTLLPPGGVQFLPGIPPVNGSNCAQFSGAMHCWNKLSGIVFDNNGNLWANSMDPVAAGTFEFAPGGSCGAPVCPLNFTPDHAGMHAFPDGITIAPAADPLNPGKILLANLLGPTIDIIDPHSCTGQIVSGGNWILGTCTGSTFITINGEPKYVSYSQSCPNPDNNGYLEICKQSNPYYPVTGTFDFTATAPQFGTPTIQVPVGECSGPVEVPSGQVTVTEAPTIGDLVSDVTACSYNEFGECVPDLIGWTLPDLYATVPVASGGVSSETLTTFTNYAAFPGQLKVCKIAGPGTPVGTEFTFNVTGLPPFQLEAGPANQGGFCMLAGTLAVNTPVTIAETPNAMYPLTEVTDQCNACTYTVDLPQSSMTTTIGSGITVVSFTNTRGGGKQVRCLACEN